MTWNIEDYWHTPLHRVDCALVGVDLVLRTPLGGDSDTAALVDAACALLHAWRDLMATLTAGNPPAPLPDLTRRRTRLQAALTGVAAALTAATPLN